MKHLFIRVLLLMLVLLPLIPLFEMYADVRRAYEDK